MDRAMCQYWVFRQSIEHDHWARNLFSSYEKRKKLSFRDPFLSLSVKFGLATLVRERVWKDDRMLHGSDSGLNGKEQTPWLAVLDYLREVDRRRWIGYYDTSENGTSRLAVIISLFIQHGANPNGLLVETKFDPSASAVEIITTIYRKYAAPEFGRLRKVLIDKGALEQEGHGILYQPPCQMQEATGEDITKKREKEDRKGGEED
ncbi:hypothetical protein N7447_008295 [Penicillium robsamsonii]|uniref:uncharacterized protein n=1 Tax=Penicillium robsamsonii TaxID=1792511 RepID=UPI00254873DF|nr:uncharacterized protein N7447_008295 [Penicillium robsamsonii]KAJ5816062.1 hypothetical protein N7447_008295 [Penicillium robsamsonii]